MRPHHDAEPDERGSAAPPASRRSWTAAELMAARFPAPCWAVPGLIAEGVALLAGPPKIGKSWLTLGLAEAIASSTTALGSIHVAPGAVLYLALEDTARRLQARLRKLLANRPAPDTLTLVTTCPPFGQGGDELITDWLNRQPTARIVVIDVFAKMRGPAPPGISTYEADYAAIGRVKRIADHYSVAVVLVHHVRKAGSDDFLAEVSGTNGLAGAAPMPSWSSNAPVGPRTGCCTSPAATWTKPSTPWRSNPPPAPGACWTAQRSTTPLATPARSSCGSSASTRAPGPRTSPPRWSWTTRSSARPARAWSTPASSPKTAPAATPSPTR